MNGLTRCLRGARTDEVNDAEVIIAEEECVRADLHKAAGTAMHDRAPLDAGKESGNEVMWSAIGRGEPNDPIASADAGVAGSVEGDKESIAKERVGGAKIGEPERRTVSGEGCVGGGHRFAGGKRRGSVSEAGVGIAGENMASARCEVGASCGNARLMAVNGVGGGEGRDRSEGFGIVEGGKRRSVVDGFARSEVTGRPAIVGRSGRRGIDMEERVLRKLIA